METAEKDACSRSVLEMCALIGLDEADDDGDDDETKVYNETTAALQKKRYCDKRERNIPERKEEEKAKTKEHQFFR